MGMPVFNKLDFMRDRILHNRRRLADSIPRKICLGRTRAEDEIDIERSKRFLSTLFETQSFALLLDEAARTVNKLFHALCYDVSRNNVWSSSSHGGGESI